MLKPRELSALKKYLSERDGAKLVHPHSKTLNEYTIGGATFAYLETGKQLLRLSLRSDPELARLLREKYEEVSAGHKLDGRKWNTIVISGQLSYNELTALIEHSYQLAKEESNRTTNRAS